MARPFDRRVFREDLRPLDRRWEIQRRAMVLPALPVPLRGHHGTVRAVADPDPLRVLDIGGGQHALLAKKLWNDHATVADVTEDHLNYVREQGVETVRWDLGREEPPFTEPFDAIIFSEVIEHFPCAGYIALERLRRCLRPGGLLICTTPNFYRLRNIVYTLIGKQIFDHFRRPEAGGGGHLIEYDVPRLRYQFNEAAIQRYFDRLREFHHSPNSPVFRVMYWLGQPLFLIPRFRDCLVAICASLIARRRVFERAEHAGSSLCSTPTVSRRRGRWRAERFGSLHLPARSGCRTIGIPFGSRTVALVIEGF